MAESSTLLRPAGVTGLRQWSGYIQEITTPLALRSSRQRIQTYKAMGPDPYIGSSLLALNLIMRQAPATVMPAIPGDAASIEAGEWLEGALFQDMRHTWSETLTEIFSCLQYGWATHAILYKQRRGSRPDDDLDSKFSDGKYGFLDFEPRSQDSLLHWNFDDQQRLTGMTQQPDTGGTYIIPREQLLLFRINQHKANPEGQSLLYNCYKPWYTKEHLRAMLTIGIERNLAGYPVMSVPAAIASPSTVEEQAAHTAWKDFVTKVRVNENMGALIPSTRDEAGNLLYELKLLSVGGTQLFDIPAITRQLDLEELVAFYTDVLLMGHEKAGSYALSSDKTDVLGYALSAILDSVYGVLNRQAITRLWRLNGFDPRVQPILVPGEIESTALTELGTLMNQAAGAGLDVLSHEAEFWRRAGFSTTAEETAA